MDIYPLTHTRHGHFHNTIDRGWLFPPPPLISETTGQIYKIQKKLFDRTEKFAERNPTFLTSGSFDVQDKVKI